ncbi:peptidyl-dipeptidase Dcp protein [Oceaniovalibus guishaninsula JLT2003]|uniref:Peptidyl-dipeptidase Dcp protein n=1 Tax=Oceaniovalibus guishaninsula JLT2003 TaxID=1231392 RepID=K2HB37_9RHOB|nr:amino acid ABC transporter permease [Oceaniovalibus guishaninsula]EKE43877.1 peptidyl-dipeptidase Dcp protein [Oceaniovalibus guishaninsula JLT2003]
MPRADTRHDRDFPYWLVLACALGLWFLYRIAVDALYLQILRTLLNGAWVTFYVTVISFFCACLLGIGLALMSRSGSIVVRQAARFWVEIVRGIPILVLLLYVAFVLAPGLVSLWNWLAGPFGLEPAGTRDFALIWRAVLALVIAYSAFLAEVFRAGLSSVDHGQIEAAQSLGLKPWMRFRHIVWPQALRTILPPLGNDFIAMVKDSSLVSVLGVLDITQLGKVTAAGNFRYFETYNVVALLYLTMTVGLSLALRGLERRLRRR